MNIQMKKTPAESGFLAQFAEARQGLPGTSTQWMAKLRDDAIAAFEQAGMPHRRIEQWKYTDLRSMVPQALPPARRAHADQAVGRCAVFDAIDTVRLVFVNGYLDAELSRLDSLPQDVELMTLEDAIESPPGWVRDRLVDAEQTSADGVLALNSAFMAGGMAMRIPAGTTVDRPVELSFSFVGDSALQTIRNLIVVEAGAAVTLIETFGGPAANGYMTNVVTDLSVGDGARVDHVKVQDEGTTAVHLANLSIDMGADAILNTFAASLGSRLARNEVSLVCTGPGSDASISGAYMITGRQHCDSTIFVDHAVPGCTSRELFKGVIDEAARGVFQGKIIVRPDAQKTDGRMMTKGLLLSETAEFDAKPELEIFADDVQCAHGATSGDLDPDLLFYMRSRGVPEVEAKAMLIQAFVADAFEGIASEAIRDALGELPARWQKDRSDA